MTEMDVMMQVPTNKGEYVQKNKRAQLNLSNILFEIKYDIPANNKFFHQ